MKFLLDGEQSSRLHFRKIQLSDYDQWLPFFQDLTTSIHWVEQRETPQLACAKWYERQFHRYQNNLGGMNAIIEKETGMLIGHCGLLVQIVDQIQELEIGYSLLPHFWDKGYATEASQTCRDFAFKKELTSSLISIISVTNKPSERVAFKNGMSLSKTTVYKNNPVNIFRIEYEKWRQLKP